MKSPVVLIGIGEMGSMFARGFLRTGHPVFPVTRDQPIAEAAREIPEPELVVVAVAEADLHPVLEQIPEPWKDRLCLLQNELLPRDWEQHGIDKPTVISVWFEKKKGMDSKPIIPSPVYGPHARMVHDALASIDIPVRMLDNAEELLHELVLKNVYIVTTNVAGLKVGGNVGELWSQHESLARAVANEVIDIQEALTGKSLDREALIEGMVNAFNGDHEHQCTGRSAPARLERALDIAAEHGLTLPEMRAIQ
jgi:ketopantoate reductase